MERFIIDEHDVKECLDLTNAMLHQVVKDATEARGAMNGAESWPHIRADAWLYIEREEYAAWTKLDLKALVYKKLENEMNIVKEYLNQYLKCKYTSERLKALLWEKVGRDYERIQALRDSIILPGSASDGMPKGSGRSDKIAEAEAKIDEIQRGIDDRTKEITEQIHAAQEQMHKITDEIENMKDEQMKALITFRYISGMKWEDVAAKLNLSETHVKSHLHLRALNEFYVYNRKLFPNKYGRSIKRVKSAKNDTK